MCFIRDLYGNKTWDVGGGSGHVGEIPDVMGERMTRGREDHVSFIVW